jgi:serine/threonine protein kinase
MPQHSRPGTILGTVGYMSPEQAQGHLEDIDHRTDIFAFGCILFEAVTGQRAFEGKDALDSLHKIVHAPTPQIKELNPDAPPELQRIIRRCLAKDPDKRLTQVAVADNAQIAPASETQYVVSLSLKTETLFTLSEQIKTLLTERSIKLVFLVAMRRRCWSTSPAPLHFLRMVNN